MVRTFYSVSVVELMMNTHIRRDFSIMNKTVLLAKQNGVAVGAHPSLPDLQGFGRREMAIEPVRLWTFALPSFLNVRSNYLG